MIGRAALCVVAAARVASADATPPASGLPDAAVADAAEANLESTERRRGVVVAVAFGPNILVGFGIDRVTGRGGGLDLRIGHVATRRTVISFDFAISARLHRPATMADARADIHSQLLAGAQYYVNPSLWVRGAAGVGVYAARGIPLPTGELGDRTLAGPAALAGAGVDLLRWKSLVAGFEVATSAMINHDGLLLGFTGNLGLAFD